MWRAGVALMTLVLVVAGCGSAEEPAGVAEAQPAGVEADGEQTGDTEPTTATTEAAATGEETDSGTDTDIGDDEESSPAPAVTDDRSAYSQDPVEGDDDGQSLNDLVIDLHGFTDDVATEANRLTSFPGIPTPPDGAVITEIMTLQDPDDPADLTDLSTILSYTRVGFYSASSPDELITLYTDAYEAWGYTNVKRTEETTDSAVSTTIMLEFGEELGRPTTELIVTDENNSEVTLVKIVHRERLDGQDRYLELAGWAQPYASAGAVLSGVQVGSSYSKLDTFVSSQVQLETSWELADRSQEETTVIVREVAAASGAEFENTSTGAAVFAGPDDRISLTGNNGSMRVDIVYGLTDLVGPVESVG